MSLLQIREQIEEIEREILKNSLNSRCSIKELIIMYKKLLNIRNAFLNIYFDGYNNEDLEEIRFKINENLLNIKISIKERIGINCETEILQMRELFN